MPTNAPFTRCVTVPRSAICTEYATAGRHNQLRCVTCAHGALANASKRGLNSTNNPFPSRTTATRWYTRSAAADTPHTSGRDTRYDVSRDTSWSSPIIASGTVTEERNAAGILRCERERTNTASAVTTASNHSNRTPNRPSLRGAWP